MPHSSDTPTPPHDKAAPAGNSAADGSRRNESRPTAKPLLIGILMLFLVIAVVAILLQVFVADRIPLLTEARLEAARALWDEQGPVSYDMGLEIRGAQPGTVHIEVRDGAVIAMTRDGLSPPQRTWDVWTVPGQFDTLERELDLAEDPQHEMDVPAGTRLQLRCEFDSRYGFPRRYHRFAIGDAPEVFWRVTAFNPE